MRGANTKSLTILCALLLTGCSTSTVVGAVELPEARPSLMIQSKFFDPETPTTQRLGEIPKPPRIVLDMRNNDLFERAALCQVSFDLAMDRVALWETWEQNERDAQERLENGHVTTGNR